MNREKIKMKSEKDGLELDVAIIKPENEIKGIIQISHGMAEHKERYFSFMEYLASCGYISIIHDHRGHGGSVKRQEELGYFYDKTSEYIVEDLHQITLYIKQRYPNKELILFGHSMGSMVVRKYIKKYDQDIDKLVVCGSPSKNNQVGLALFLVKILEVIKGEHYRSKLIQKLTFGSYNKGISNPISINEWICTDREVIIAYDKDELCGFIFTLNGFKNLFTLMKEIYSKKEWIFRNEKLPILFIAGEEDPVIVSKRAWKNAQEFLKTVGYQQVSGKLYSNMRHEILNEKERKSVWKDIVNWIENKIKN